MLLVVESITLFRGGIDIQSPVLHSLCLQLHSMQTFSRRSEFDKSGKCNPAMSHYEQARGFEPGSSTLSQRH